MDGAGADFLAYMLMTEELAYGDAGICNMVNAANSFGAKVRDAGTPDRRSASCVRSRAARRWAAC